VRVVTSVGNDKKRHGEKSGGKPPKTRALLDYAVRVTREPLSSTPQTIDGLRALGWSGEEILTATHIAGFFNYYARLADALGVEPEDFMQRPAITPSKSAMQP
jgi:alkylhydroperoxidase family enzyme